MRVREIVDGRLPIGAVLRRAARAWGDVEAVCGRSGRLTYAEFDRAVDRAAAALIREGVEPGDRIAVSLPNDLDVAVTFYAAARAGAVWVGINLPLARPEKQHIIDDAQPRLMIATQGVVDQLAGAAGRCRIVSVDREWRQFLDDAPETPIDRDSGFDAPAAIAYTSGTTGAPKGVIHSHRTVLVPGSVTTERFGSDVGQRWGFCLALNILNMQVQLVQMAQFGGTAVVMDRVDAVGIVEWVQGERIEWVAVVPATMHSLASDPAIDADALRSLDGLMVGAADVPVAVVERFAAKFGLRPTVNYGLTELPWLLSTREADVESHGPGDVGFPYGHLELAILDDELRPSAHGKTGEICVRPAQHGPWAGTFATMLGHWGQAASVPSPVIDGWLHTGDMGFVDNDGHLFIRDRKKAMINRGGANVYPAEVERVLALDPRLSGYAVVGQADERLGERVVALVEAPGVDADAIVADLRALCAEHLAKYKNPDRYVVVEQLPRNSMGKVHRSRLGDLLSPLT